MSDSRAKLRRRILMVDQELDLRVGLGLMLTSAGYEVSHTDNGNEAIAMHRCNPFDVVIVDMVLPGKDGLETMTALRSESSPPKFIATSGEGRFPAALYLRMAGLLGAQRVLAKPFESEQLLAAVQSVLGEI